MTETIWTTWLAHPIKDYQIEALTVDPCQVMANYLPNKRAPKARDYIVTHRTVVFIPLPDGTLKRKFMNHYLLMTYAHFSKHYVWDPQPGQTTFQTQVCKPKY